MKCESGQDRLLLSVCIRPGDQWSHRPSRDSPLKGHRLWCIFREQQLRVIGTGTGRRIVLLGDAHGFIIEDMREITLGSTCLIEHPEEPVGGMPQDGVSAFIISVNKTDPWKFDLDGIDRLATTDQLRAATRGVLHM